MPNLDLLAQLEERQAKGDRADEDDRGAGGGPTINVVALPAGVEAFVDLGAPEWTVPRGEDDTVTAIFEGEEELVGNVERSGKAALGHEEVDEKALRRPEIAAVVLPGALVVLFDSFQEFVARRSLFRRVFPLSGLAFGRPRERREGSAWFSASRPLEFVAGLRRWQCGSLRGPPNLELNPVASGRSRNVEALADTGHEAR
jgi:hypothetical protein